MHVLEVQLIRLLQQNLHEVRTLQNGHHLLTYADKLSQDVFLAHPQNDDVVEVRTQFPTFKQLPVLFNCIWVFVEGSLAKFTKSFPHSDLVLHGDRRGSDALVGQLSDFYVGNFR